MEGESIVYIQLDLQDFLAHYRVEDRRDEVVIDQMFDVGVRCHPHLGVGRQGRQLGIGQPSM
jgi:hypothetical protein